MSELQFRSLVDVPLETLHAAFLAAFADYAVPMQLDVAGLSALMLRRGYAAELSAGAFDGERLLAFHLICRGRWQGTPTVYDTASGVLPEARGRRLSQRLFEWLLPRWQAAGMKRAMLEVLVGNLPARRSYEAAGFSVSRAFDCLQLANKPELVLPEAVVPQLEDSNVWPEVALDWFHVEPAWQNSVAALAATPQRFKRISLQRNGVLLAVGMLNPLSGEAPLFAVAPDCRRQGWGRILLAAMAAQCDMPLRMINLQAEGPSVALLHKLGASSTAQQVEMVWALTPSVLPQAQATSRA
ncbi:GNAT family N-acetyltransferase [Chitinimonas naiadis]